MEPARTHRSRPVALPPPSNLGGETSTSAAVGRARPSEIAKMVCASEAQEDIATNLGNVQPTTVTTPTWKDSVYSCRYVYPSGAVTLSVKELRNAAATHALLREARRHPRPSAGQARARRRRVHGERRLRRRPQGLQGPERRRLAAHREAGHDAGARPVARRPERRRDRARLLDRRVAHDPDGLKGRSPGESCPR